MTAVSRPGIGSMRSDEVPKGLWQWQQTVSELVDQIRALTALRDGLDSWIGCGCLSLRTCGIQNPADIAAVQGIHAAHLPSSLAASQNTRGPG